jgi:hypothetical protein
MMQYALLIVMPEDWNEHQSARLGDVLAAIVLPTGCEMVLTLPSPDGEAEGPKLKEWVA